MQALPLADPGLPDLRSALRSVRRISALAVQGWRSVTSHRSAVADRVLAASRSTSRVSPAVGLAIGPGLRPALGRQAAQPAGPGGQDELLALGGSVAALLRPRQPA